MCLLPETKGLGERTSYASLVLKRKREKNVMQVCVMFSKKVSVRILISPLTITL